MKTILIIIAVAIICILALAVLSMNKAQDVKEEDGEKEDDISIWEALGLEDDVRD